MGVEWFWREGGWSILWRFDYLFAFPLRSLVLVLEIGQIYSANLSSGGGRSLGDVICD